jgi:hypothetical protein
MGREFQPLHIFPLLFDQPFLGAVIILWKELFLMPPPLSMHVLPHLKLPKSAPLQLDM